MLAFDPYHIETINFVRQIIRPLHYRKAASGKGEMSSRQSAGASRFIDRLEADGYSLLTHDLILHAQSLTVNYRETVGSRSQVLSKSKQGQQL